MGASGPTISSRRAAEVLQRAAAKRAIVLGDMVADEHVIGSATRLSREAPLPVIEEHQRILVPGAGANVATNLRGLGCDVAVAGVVGADAMADRLSEQLEQRGIATDGLIRDADRTTAVKLRVWAGGDRQRPQSMIARVDSVDRSPVKPATVDAMASFLDSAIPSADALVISDYEAGVVSSSILRSALPAARDAGLVVTADAHGQLARFKDATLLTPNQPEAEAELGRQITSTSEAQAAAGELRQAIGVEAVLVTLGAAGMVLDAGDQGRALFPAAVAGRVVDPSGAGDTVAAAMTAAFLGGATPHEAAALAALAARIVVRQLGVVVVSAEQIVSEAGDGDA
ncbi:MAG: PfkB family carbohydrate kinase [Chloroflexota bacterium]|nr:PfkB family carbohydrate kinase [Chloroflexota bacterium]MDE2896994.1 PfkB family carbohydrate kinase [Chloroflexota bacterium]